MKQTLFIILILALGAISSCSKSRNSASTQAISSESISQLATESTFQEATSISTQPPRVIVVTIDPTFLPQNEKILKGHFKQVCVNVNLEMSNFSSFKGSVVLYDRFKEIHYIQTLPPNNRIELSNAQPYSIKVSPNGKWIAYLQDTAPYQYNFRLIVRSADGKIQKTFDPETIGDVTGISGWLNDENIALELLSKQPLSTLIAVNPFTGNQQKFPPDFPKIYNGGTWEWDSSGLTVYSPDLYYVVYPVNYGDTPPRYILWDIQNNREITAIVTGDLTKRPQWADDGKSVAVTVDTSYNSFSANEFYSASIGGTVIQISKLGELFPGTTTKIRDWNWSPDSKYIAFWLDFYQGKSLSEERLMILDTQTGDIVDPCIQGDQIQIATNLFPYTTAPIWSPDGSSLLIENRYEIDKSRLILLELESNAAYQLAENVSPLGWVVSKP